MRRRIPVVLALALVLTSGAWGRSYGGASGTGPYGIHASRLAAQARAPEQAYGFEGLGAEEFPAFGAFSWRPYNDSWSSAFGMTYRTQRHLQARRRGAVSGAPRGDAGPLDAARPLSAYDEATGGHRPLVQAVQADQRVHPARLSRDAAPADMVASVLARLEGKQRASLTLALRSRDGRRVRPLMLYRAELRGDTWECTFYDPHLQVAEVADGEPRSHVFGSPDQPGGGRFHQLRLPADGVGRPQVAHSWVATLDHHQQDGAAFAALADFAWLDLDWGQLSLVDHAADAWDPAGITGGGEVFGGHDRALVDFHFGASDAAAAQLGVELD